MLVKCDCLGTLFTVALDNETMQVKIQCARCNKIGTVEIVPDRR